MHIQDKCIAQSSKIYCTFSQNVMLSWQRWIAAQSSKMYSTYMNCTAPAQKNALHIHQMYCTRNKNVLHVHEMYYICNKNILHMHIHEMYCTRNKHVLHNRPNALHSHQSCSSVCCLLSATSTTVLFTFFSCFSNPWNLVTVYAHILMLDSMLLCI